MILKKKGENFKYLGAIFTIGERIVADGDSYCKGLSGVITEIAIGADRYTYNDTPDICCDFEAPKDAGENDNYDMVIMAPEMLKRMEINRYLINRLIKFAKGHDWDVVKEDETSYYFSQYSPAGHDFGFTVDSKDDPWKLLENIDKTYQDFDVSEEAYLWLDSLGHGKNGAPYEMIDVYRDVETSAESIRELYDTLDDRLREVIDEEMRDLQEFEGDAAVEPAYGSGDLHKPGKYALLGADNIDTDISMSVYDTFEDAHKAMQETYHDIVYDYDDDVEKSDITETGASILFNDGDIFYWNVKRIDL